MFSIALTVKIAMKIVAKSPLALQTDQEGYRGSCYENSLIGRMAEVEKDLRPSGFITVNGESWQALSEGRYIKKGTKVEIIGGRGSHLIVR